VRHKTALNGGKRRIARTGDLFGENILQGSDAVRLPIRA
jgi:hypothetical protein